jgi:uncharacterized protein YqhQ
MSERMPTYGGQAVIEGVMMRGSKGVAIAMRAPDNNIVLHTERLSSVYRSKILKAPFLRGLITLWDAMGLGIRALTISANTQTGEDEKLEGASLYLTLAFSLVLGVGLFFLAPAAVGQLLEHRMALGSWWGNIIEGVLRLVLLIGYIWGVGKIAEIRRVFAYHGAEHKTINAFEAGVELIPENVARFSVEHPRCGTAFLLTLVLLSILVFSLFGPLSIVERLLSRLLLLPVLAGIAYEILRWTSNNLNLPAVRFMVKPNLALQHLTTREPSLDMLEVAIAAFNAMRSQETELSM